MSDTGSGFLSRWARRKAQARQGALPEPTDLPAVPSTEPPPSSSDRPAAPAAPWARGPAAAGAGTIATATQAASTSSAATPTDAPDAESPQAPAAATPAPPPPTLDDVALLDRDAADYSRFVARDVQPEVRNAALKKLFTDPHFNVMDGLDIYIDDYSQPDPLPPGMLERMAQGQFLGLFTQAPEPAGADGLAAASEEGHDATAELDGDAATDGAAASPAAAPPADPHHPPSPPTDPAR